MKNICFIIFCLLTLNLLNVATAVTQTKQIGEVKITIKTPITVVEQAQAINYFDNGSVTIGNAKADVESCIEKFSFRKI